MKASYTHRILTLFVPIIWLVPLSVSATKDSTYYQRESQARESAQNFYTTLMQVSDLTLLSAYSEYDKAWPDTKQFPAKPYFIQAQIQTPIPIGGRWAKNVKSGLRFAVFLHPDMEVRLLRNDRSRGDTSTPIRTPSFKPGVTLFITQSKLWDNRKDQHYFGFKIFHLSNGQDGPHFRPQDGGYYNRYNGDFSDFIIFQLIYGGTYSFDHQKIDTTKPIYRSRYNRTLYTSSQIYWKAGLTFYPKVFVDSLLCAEHMYGRYRSNIQIGWIYAPIYQPGIYDHRHGIYRPLYAPERRERFRIWADMEYIWDAPYRTGPLGDLRTVPIYDITKRLNISVTGSFRIWGTPFAGIFFQVGYYGSDPYNVYFQQSLFVVRAGISGGFLVYRFRHTPVQL
ncbi:MAG: hypothetical protein JST83_01345 [Bacteroidetes bacterium]|nr:hypothetical protein [Bacteroidota bacterium]